MRPGALARIPVAAVPEVRFDPDCAICGQVPDARCDCEATAMHAAVKDAESRVIKSEYRNVRYASFYIP